MSTGRELTTKQQGGEIAGKKDWRAFLSNERFNAALAEACSEHLDPKELLSVCATLISGDEKLAKCTPSSILAALIQAGNRGLVPTGTADGGFLIARWNKDANAYVCHFQVSYQGELAQIERAFPVKSTTVEVVHEKDVFIHRPAQEDNQITHEPFRGSHSERGKLQFAYCIIRGQDGRRYEAVVDVDDIAKAMERSEGLYYKDGKPNMNSPWHSDTEAMWKKTAVHRVGKIVPKKKPFIWEREEEEHFSAIRAQRLEPTGEPAARLLTQLAGRGEGSGAKPSPTEEGGSGSPSTPDQEPEPAKASTGTPAKTPAELVAYAGSLGFDEQAVRDEVQVAFPKHKLGDLTEKQVSEMALIFAKAEPK